MNLTNLVSEKHCVDGLFIPNELLNICVSLPAGTTFLCPSEEKYEAQNRAVDRFLEVVDLFDLNSARP